MELPRFKYHPDPVATGSVVVSVETCQVCGQARGFIYAGALYSAQDAERVCSWCIADGNAHARLGAEFTDAAAVGGHGKWEAVPAEVVREVAERTPGFSSWQGERWFTHCGDAAAFLGPMGRAELEALGAEAVAVVRAESGYDEREWASYLASLDREHGPTAYLFRCLHCGALGGYSDCP